MKIIRSVLKEFSTTGKSDQLNKKYFKLLILLYLAGFSSFAQQVVISGKVTDTLQTPLGYANILDIPENDNEEVAFAID
ncbi:hypothetical protein SAMN05428642_101694 [Flaviramulus basaltis]|uniref:CarboxypepD_reg-like domain-containing protein n=1 Tax=Flaviramulus basaltis TaxID=369401 RepID=A0A1K2IC90_9FLAO|nr:hypothetical protein [Flaviramulus basaltis]SFZ90017.1 hypothetical protein SAMN05428642_101694 [Flaviramulus basaltis]